MGFLDRLRRRSALDDVLAGELLVPIPTLTGPPRVEVLEEDRQLEVVTVEDDAGRLVLPTFTSEAALNEWKPEGSPYMALPARLVVELLAVSDWDRIVVDGGGGHGFSITRVDARQLVRMSQLSSIPAGEVRIGLPAEPPSEEMVEALRRACEAVPTLAEVYLYQWQLVERDEPPSLAVGFRLAENADPEGAARSLAGTIDSSAWGYEHLDYVPLEGELLEP